MANVNDYPVTNGDLIGDDNQIDNIVDLLGGGTPVSNQTLNKNDFPIHSSLVIGSDNKVYDLKDLIGSPIDPDDFIPNEGNTLENENFYLGRDNMSFTTQRTFEVESDNGGELSVNNGVDITSTDGSTLNVGANITATADSDVVLTSGDNSSITLSDDIVLVANNTTAMTINDETISVEEDIQTTITEFENNSLVTKQYVDDNTINESIVDVTVLPTGSNIKDMIYRMPVYENTSITYDFTQTNIDNIFSVDFNDFSCLTVEDTSPDVDTPQYKITPKTGITVFVNMGAGVGDETLEFIAYGREDNENWGEIKTNLGWYIYSGGDIDTLSVTGTFTLKTPNDYKLYAGDSTNQTTTELSSGSNDVICTQAEYNALPSSKLTDGVSYYITDVNNIQNGNNISW